MIINNLTLPSTTHSLPSSWFLSKGAVMVRVMKIRGLHQLGIVRPMPLYVKLKMRDARKKLYSKVSWVVFVVTRTLSSHEGSAGAGTPVA
jgi:hypothetical protein